MARKRQKRLGTGEPEQLALETGAEASKALAPLEPRTLDRPQSSQMLVAFFVEQSRACGIPTPQRVTNILSRYVKDLLDEGIEAEAVRAGIARMIERRVFSPDRLAIFVMEAAAPREAKRYGRGLTTAQIEALRASGDLEKAVQRLKERGF